MEIVISVIAVVLAVSCLFMVTKSDLSDYFRAKARNSKPDARGEHK